MGSARERQAGYEDPWGWGVVGPTLDTLCTQKGRGRGLLL
jgi:hypothetical protein